MTAAEGPVKVAAWAAVKVAARAAVKVGAAGLVKAGAAGLVKVGTVMGVSVREAMVAAVTCPAVEESVAGAAAMVWAAMVRAATAAVEASAGVPQAPF